MIPKVIYQTWHTNKIPEPIQSGINKMRNENPEYRYELHLDEQARTFVEENYSKQILEIYDSLLVGAAKADLWRYMMLYKYGGIYLDIDSVWKKPFKELLSDEDNAIISRENNSGLFVQWCLIFNKEHPVLKYAIEKACTNILFRSQDNVVYLTGPIVFSEAVKRTYEGIDVYGLSDEEANKQINNKKMGVKRCRVYSHDYGDFAQYKHEQADNILYTEKPYWHEQQKSGIIK